MELVRNYEKRILLFFLGIALILGIRFPVFADEVQYPQDVRTEVKEGDYSGKLVILQTNDVHGELEGYAQVAALAKTYRNMGAEVLLLDSGDFAQGTIYTNYSRGVDTVKLMNAVGYQYAILGNHDFDYGYKQEEELRSEAEFTLLCANILKEGESICQENLLYTAENGVKVGLFGLDTPETSTKASPELVKGLKFLAGTELAECAKKQVNTLKDEGADLVIALTHLGVDQETAEGQNRSIDVYRAVPEIDLMLDGHSHTVMTAGPDSEPIQSTGSYFQNIGVVIIGSDAKIEDRFLLSTDQLPKDSAILEMVTDIKDIVDAKYGEVVGKSEVELSGEREKNRAMETNNGNFITDAMYWYAEKTGMLEGLDDVMVMMNGGSIRAAIPKGEVTKRELFDVSPYGNLLNVISLTGNELLELLEASTFSTPATIGGFPQMKGITYSIDTTRKYDVGELYPDSTYHRPASIRRVKVEKVGDQAFDPDATYHMLTIDFLAEGGDQAAVLRGKKPTAISALPMDQILEEYLQEGLGGTIPKAKYGKVRGDLTIIYEKNGWMLEDGLWFYYKDSKPCTGWLQYKNKWYFLKASGAMQTGWRKLSGKWYYFKPSGAMAAKEWCRGYWLNTDGTWTYPEKGSWHKNKNGWWFSDTSGWYARNSWQKINDVWYHFDGEGYLEEK